MFDLDINTILFLFIAGILCALIGGIVLCVIGKKWFEKSKIRLGVTLIAISVVAILCLVAFYVYVCIAFSPIYEEDIVVTSPDGEYELIIREWYAVGCSGADVYVKKGSSEEKADELHFGDNGSPFDDGLYEIEWEDDYVKMTYHSGLDNGTPWRSTKIKLE